MSNTSFTESEVDNNEIKKYVIPLFKNQGSGDRKGSEDISKKSISEQPYFVDKNKYNNHFAVLNFGGKKQLMSIP